MNNANIQLPLCSRCHQNPVSSLRSVICESCWRKEWRAKIKNDSQRPLCSRCHQNPVVSLRSGICRSCYQKEQLEKRNNGPQTLLCSRCHNRPVMSIASGLCKTCYNKELNARRRVTTREFIPSSDYVTRTLKEAKLSNSLEYLGALVILCSSNAHLDAVKQWVSSGFNISSAVKKFKLTQFYFRNNILIPALNRAALLIGKQCNDREYTGSTKSVADIINDARLSDDLDLLCALLIICSDNLECISMLKHWSANRFSIKSVISRYGIYPEAFRETVIKPAIENVAKLIGVASKDAEDVGIHRFREYGSTALLGARNVAEKEQIMAWIENQYQYRVTALKINIDVAILHQRIAGAYHRGNKLLCQTPKL